MSNRTNFTTFFASLLFILVGTFSAKAQYVPCTDKVIAMHYDSRFYGVGGGCGNEATVLRDNLISRGYTVNTFSGTVAATWQNALNNADVLVIPENERTDLWSALPASTRTVIANWVNGGGGMLTNGYFSQEGARLINVIFGHSTAQGGTVFGGTSPLNAAGATGTEFAGGPSPINTASATYSLSIGTLPAGAKVIYNNGNNAWVSLWDQGSGKVCWLGYDWFCPSTTTRNQWSEVWDRAICEVGGPKTCCDNETLFEVTCVGDITVSIDESGMYVFNGEDLVADAGACTSALSYSTNPAEVSCVDVGSTIPVTVSVTLDECGKTATCEVMVNVVDGVAPTFSKCPMNTTLSLDPGLCEIVFNFDVEAVDNCATQAKFEDQTGGQPLTLFNLTCGFGTTDVSYLRAYQGDPIGACVIDSVISGVSQATGSGTMNVNVYEYNGAGINFANFTQVGGDSWNVTAGTATTLHTFTPAAVVPAGSDYVIESRCSIVLSLEVSLLD